MFYLARSEVVENFHIILRQKCRMSGKKKRLAMRSKFFFVEQTRFCKLCILRGYMTSQNMHIHTGNPYLRGGGEKLTAVELRGENQTCTYSIRTTYHSYNEISHIPVCDLGRDLSDV